MTTATATITPDASRDMTRREAQVWTNQQIPYPNLADDKEVADRARILAQQIISQHNADMVDKYEEWAWLDFILKGNAVDGDLSTDVHVPELLKAERRLVPRLEQAFMGSGVRWFEARGRDRMDRIRSNAISAMLEWQLEQTQFRLLMQPLWRSYLRYEICAVKVQWERRVEEIPYHWVETKVVNGKTQYIPHRQFKEVVTFEGNRIRIVDPFRLIVDVRQANVQDLDYIGDVSEPSIEDLWNMQDLGMLKNVDEIGSQEEKNLGKNYVTQSHRAYERMRRSGTGSTTKLSGSTTHLERPEVVEIWTWMKLRGSDKRPKRVVITMANGYTMLRVQENPNDKKHVPYAIGHSSSNGFTFFDRGVLTPAIQTQREIDRHRATMLDSHEKVAQPPLLVEGDSDLPNSMLPLRRGSVWRNVGKLIPMQFGNSLSFAPYITDMLRSDLETTTGALLLEQQATEGRTATEIDRKYEENNRQMIGHLRNFGHFADQLLTIMYNHCQQYITDKTKMRVLDRGRAKLLGDTYTIVPTELMHAVDFEFSGLARAQNYGMHGQRLLNWATVFMPVLETNPDKFNLVALAKTAYGSMVGGEIEDDIVRDDADVSEGEPQEIENAYLRQGIQLPVHPTDEDMEHLEKMQADGLIDRMRDPKTGEDERISIEMHYRAHITQGRRKMQEQQAEEMAMERKQMLMGQPGAPPAGGFESKPAGNATNGPTTDRQAKSAARSPTAPSNGGEKAA